MKTKLSFTSAIASNDPRDLIPVLRDLKILGEGAMSVVEAQRAGESITILSPAHWPTIDDALAGLFVPRLIMLLGHPDNEVSFLAGEALEASPQVLVPLLEAIRPGHDLSDAVEGTDIVTVVIDAFLGVGRPLSPERLLALLGRAAIPELVKRARHMRRQCHPIEVL